MARIDLPYGDGLLPIEIPDSHLGERVSPFGVSAPVDPDKVIQTALDHPEGTPPLENLVKPGQRVAVIIDDISRLTPIQMMLPPVLERLVKGGINRNDIRIVIGLGTHRPMTQAEIISKTGHEIAAEFDIVNVPAWDEKQMVYLGTSGIGIPAWVNRIIVEADIRVGIGSITPHTDVGYSGGAKIILPGVCGDLTVNAFHVRAVDLYTNQLGIIETGLRQDLETFVADHVGLDFIFNAILTRKGSLFQCVAGHFFKAHRRGVRLAREV
ncbi:MAG TPA: DUF2088 domain-containing protein [Desulfobacterales bacterium]|nr:DUF2088 domain-containing protein [Desulfobacterales bacterium]